LLSVGNSRAAANLVSDLCGASRAVPSADDRDLEQNGDNSTDNIDWELFSESPDDQPLPKITSKFALQPNHPLTAMDVVLAFLNASNSFAKKVRICAEIQIVGALQMRRKGRSQWRFPSELSDAFVEGLKNRKKVPWLA
jgi:hypothetical protein